MNHIFHKLGLAAATVALGLAPAVALASGPGGTHGASHSAPGHALTHHASPTTDGTGTTVSGSPATPAHAYGRLCQGESHHHVARQPGTPFSTCVSDMARAAHGAHTNPHRLCANESQRHVEGQKGTPYSQCVSAAARLHGRQGDQGTQSGDTSTSPDSTDPAVGAPTTDTTTTAGTTTAPAAP